MQTRNGATGMGIVLSAETPTSHEVEEQDGGTEGIQEKLSLL